MAFFGDLGKALGLGSTSDVAKFAVNAGASYASGGVIPIQTSPFERSEPQMIYTTEGNQYPQNMGSNSGIGMQSSGGGFFSNLGQGIGNFGTGLGQFARDGCQFAHARSTFFEKPTRTRFDWWRTWFRCNGVIRLRFR